MNDDYVALAEATAEARQANFYIGVRPLGKGWFAHCDGIEWDGDSPDMAVRSVVQELQRIDRNVYTDQIVWAVYRHSEKVEWGLDSIHVTYKSADARIRSLGPLALKVEQFSLEGVE